ncbi:hypothetical protein J4E82_003010 [Alternaria postmessia]|uniref:uncharacterized protein n=1 Tax=Alternaria postmessia TaxID=1187938 RepID=UPI0022242B87|nr:uncharacterized protein J4E82_003010 [Alternaria postmessia]KAI5378314.1 hypothetical protein J4E82_003010 [Alternaria postmessia]
MDAKRCSHCQKPATTICFGCKTHVYCNGDHRRADWDNHKEYCESVQLETSLTMAAEVVQQAWLTLKEYTWPIPISKVELEDQKVVAYEDGTATKTLFSDLSDVWFPDQVAEHALMCFRYPFMPLVLTESLITQLIKQSEFHLHEVEVELKDPLRTVTFVHANGTKRSNWPFHRLMLLRITHKRSGKRWYMNPSGTDFGLTQNIFPAAEFESVHLKRLCRVFNVGKCREFEEACARIQRSDSFLTQIDLTIAWLMRKVLSNFLRQPGNALASIVRRPGTVSSAWKQSLTNVLTEAVRGYVARYDPRQYLHAVHRETDRIVCEGMIQEVAHRHIFVDVRTAAERADNSAPETDAAQYLLQLRNQFSGPQLDLVLAAIRSTNLG